MLDTFIKTLYEAGSMAWKKQGYLSGIKVKKDCSSVTEVDLEVSILIRKNISPFTKQNI